MLFSKESLVVIYLTQRTNKLIIDISLTEKQLEHLK